MAYQNLTSESMLNHPNIASLNNSIILMDNLDRDVILTDIERNRYLNQPIKYVSTLSIMLCTNGSVDLRIGLEDHQMLSNDALIMGNGIISSLKDMSNTARFCSIVLNEEFYYPLVNNIFFSIVQGISPQNPICHLTEDHMGECIQIYRLIKDKLLDKEEDRSITAEIVKGFIQALLYILYASYIEQERNLKKLNTKTTRKQDLYIRFIELVKKNFAHERNIKYYAEQLYVTPRYLSQVVYKESGHYASEHIDNYVISEAKQLVIGRQYSILQISKMLNFSSISLFGRYFKKFTGYSPTQFAALNK